MNSNEDYMSSEKKPLPAQADQKIQESTPPTPLPASAQERNDAIVRAERARIKQIQKGKCNF